MDVAEREVRRVVEQTGASRLIHGHTHRPGRHRADWGDRYVLGAWEWCGWLARQRRRGKRRNWSASRYGAITSLASGPLWKRKVVSGCMTRSTSLRAASSRRSSSGLSHTLPQDRGTVGSGAPRNRAAAIKVPEICGQNLRPDPETVRSCGLPPRHPSAACRPACRVRLVGSRLADPPHSDSGDSAHSRSPRLADEPAPARNGAAPPGPGVTGSAAAPGGPRTDTAGQRGAGRLLLAVGVIDEQFRQVIGRLFEPGPVWDSGESPDTAFTSSSFAIAPCSLSRDVEVRFRTGPPNAQRAPRRHAGRVRRRDRRFCGQRGRVPQIGPIAGTAQHLVGERGHGKYVPLRNLETSATSLSTASSLIARWLSTAPSRSLCSRSQTS